MSSGRVLITGVSSGLGHGFAQAYLEDGWQVYGLSRRAPEGLGGAASDSGDLHFRSLDLAQYDAIAPAVRALLAGIDRLDLVILNAGVLGEIEDLRDASIERLRHTMEVNLWANKAILDTLFAESNATATGDEAGPIAVEQVVTISSGASINGHRGWSGYSISKAAVNMLTMLYAAEVPETHFTALAPGLIDTAMQDYMSNEADVNKFASVQRLRDARGTDAMPGPYAAARKIMPVFSRLKQDHVSGQFADVRKL
ncbi:MAG: SDR family NAD(P)-dependent oxidoreductase [bacterium]|nr:SDR family NAD(P)-dependent oxidoreductase [bacterium]